MGSWPWGFYFVEPIFRITSHAARRTIRSLAGIMKLKCCLDWWVRLTVVGTMGATADKLLKIPFKWKISRAPSTSCMFESNER